MQQILNSAPTQRPSFSTGASLEQAALEFALADYRWRVQSADPAQWTDPQKQRDLAIAFLRYHATKLALTAQSESVGAA